MKEHTELTLSLYKKWDLIRYITKLEQIMNKAIKALDKESSPSVRRAVKILRCENVRIDSKDTRGDGL